uniref:MmgE/PrpD family protein n=1 Tax=Fervidicoccus fontis TaxID=683846 RepID=A0A7J3ZNN8_9CREN
MLAGCSTLNKRGVLEEIISISIEKAERVGPSQVNKAKTILIDIISVASAGFIMDSKPQLLFNLIARRSNGPSTIFGHWSKSGVLTASVVNAFSSHVLELDDWLSPGYVYAGASVVPSVLAVSEMLDCDLETAIKAIVLGYEVAGRVGMLLGRSHYRYWHTTSTAGGVGAASAATYLLEGSNEEKIAKAALTAALYGAGIKTLIWKNISLKPFSPAHASFVALASMSLKDFVVRVPKAYESELGICKLMHGECNIEGALNPPWDYAIEFVTHKIFPVSRVAQTLVHAALRLSEKVKVDRIKEIRVETFEEACQLADITEPLTAEEARFSLTFLTSLGIAQGWHGIYNLKFEVSNPLVRSLERKVRVSVREDFNALYPEKQPVRIVVLQEGGERLEVYEDTPIGSPGSLENESLVLRKAEELLLDAGDAQALKVISSLRESGLATPVRALLEQ